MVLLVAALAGHFSTLLRATVRTLLPDHDVYVTDWHNARDIGIEHGTFGLDDYIAQVIADLEYIGPGVHMLSVCQPCPAALAATALMAADDKPAQPEAAHPHGRPGRHTRQSHQGQPARPLQAAQLVRTERDRHGAPALSGSLQAGLPRLPPGGRAS